MLKDNDIIGPYKLIHELGQGGFGVVWLAERHNADPNRVALKYQQLIEPVLQNVANSTISTDISVDAVQQVGRLTFLSRLLGSTGASFIGSLGLVLVVFISTFARMHNMSSAKAAQWPFDPSGYFYVKEKMPEQFDDFDHVTLMNPHVLQLMGKEADAFPRSGVYTAKGEVYKFSAINTDPSRDLRRLLFEFETETINGISYKFAGEFLKTYIFEEFITDQKEVVAKGQLLKLKHGQTIAEASVQFTYSGKPPDIKDKVNAKYPSGKTDLMYAAAKGDLVKVQALLAEGANVNLIDARGVSALMYALKYGRGEDLDDELVKTLIAAGANVNLTPQDGHTALIIAAYREGRFVKVLLAAGADPNARDESGITALMHAVMAEDLGSLDDVKALIRAGANMNIRDKWGRTAMSIARGIHNEKIVSLLKQGGAKRRQLKKARPMKM